MSAVFGIINETFVSSTTGQFIQEGSIVYIIGHYIEDAPVHIKVLPPHKEGSGMLKQLLAKQTSITIPSCLVDIIYYDSIGMNPKYEVVMTSECCFCGRGKNPPAGAIGTIVGRGIYDELYLTIHWKDYDYTDCYQFTGLEIRKKVTNDMEKVEKKEPTTFKIGDFVAIKSNKSGHYFKTGTKGTITKEFLTTGVFLIESNDGTCWAVGPSDLKLATARKKNVQNGKTKKDAGDNSSNDGSSGRATSKKQPSVRKTGAKRASAEVSNL